MLIAWLEAPPSSETGAEHWTTLAQEHTHYLLERGKFFEASDGPSEPGRPGECYRNAQRWSFTNGDRYIEGVALKGSDEDEGGAAVIPHAWCVGHGNVVIETTWGARAVAYFGVAIDRPKVLWMFEEDRAEGFPPGGSAPILPIVIRGGARE